MANTVAIENVDVARGVSGNIVGIECRLQGRGTVAAVVGDAGARNRRDDPARIYFANAVIAQVTDKEIAQWIKSDSARPGYCSLIRLPAVARPTPHPVACKSADGT